jgi:hypothetical protein
VNKKEINGPAIRSKLLPVGDIIGDPGHGSTEHLRKEGSTKDGQCYIEEQI